MAKKKAEMSKIPQSELAPSFMSNVQVDMSAIESKILPPRLKIVQSQSKELLKLGFDVGNVILQPSNTKIIELDDDNPQFTPIIPLYMFSEYCKCADYNDPSGQFIVDRSFDTQSEIAARSRSQELRKVAYAGKPTLFYTYTEHLNFMVWLPDLNEYAVMVFRSAEFKVGRSFCTLICSRKAPLFGCQFVLSVEEHANDRNEWCGFKIQNPPAESGINAFVQDKALFDKLHELHNQFDSAYKENRIVIDMSDEGHGANVDDAKAEM